MYNQDDVALQLIRTPIMEMHELMHERGRPAWRWSIVIKDPRTHEFLLSHGWYVDAYIDECVSAVEDPTHPFRYMCTAFFVATNAHV